MTVKYQINRNISNLANKVSGYQGIRVSGYQGIRVSGYQGIRVYKNTYYKHFIFYTLLFTQQTAKELSSKLLNLLLKLLKYNVIIKFKFLTKPIEEIMPGIERRKVLSKASYKLPLNKCNCFNGAFHNEMKLCTIMRLCRLWQLTN